MKGDLESLTANSTQSYLSHILKSVTIASILHEYQFSFSSRAIRQVFMGVRKI
jgi:hypothetical protein